LALDQAAVSAITGSGDLRELGACGRLFGVFLIF
jgi:hypothetical protein